MAARVCDACTCNASGCDACFRRMHARTMPARVTCQCVISASSAEPVKLASCMHLSDAYPMMHICMQMRACCYVLSRGASGTCVRAWCARMEMMCGCERVRCMTRAMHANQCAGASQIDQSVQLYCATTVYHQLSHIEPDRRAHPAQAISHQQQASHRLTCTASIASN
eukprot:6199455-Pleurochrysis_carterae.AAC.3